MERIVGTGVCCNVAKISVSGIGPYELTEPEGWYGCTGEQYTVVSDVRSRLE